MVVGLGFRISLPVSSQDILKSERTVRVREVIIEGETTFLWMPIMKSKIKVMAAKVKKRWLRSDWTNVTSCVMGSVSQRYAPRAVLAAIITRTILHLVVAGCSLAMTSVNRRSKAFKSSHAVCSRDMLSVKNPLATTNEPIPLSCNFSKKLGKCVFLVDTSPPHSVPKSLKQKPFPSSNTLLQ